MARKKSLLQERVVYKPFEYQQAADYWLKQHQAHWLHTEVPMMSDLTDWNSNLNETEKNIIGSILKGFAQTETVVNDYWTQLVTKWFRKPEVIAMATIVEWSIRDESLHSEAGCWLFRTLIEENPELKTPELETAINEAALLSLQLELNFIKKCYELGDLEGCSQYDLENFIKNRVNAKLGDLGYRGIITDIDMTSIERMKWFDHLSAGKQHTDFFASRVTNYSKGHLTWDESIF